MEHFTGTVSEVPATWPWIKWWRTDGLFPERAEIFLCLRLGNLERVRSLRKLPWKERGWKNLVSFRPLTSNHFQAWQTAPCSLPVIHATIFTTHMHFFSNSHLNLSSLFWPFARADSSSSHARLLYEGSWLVLGKEADCLLNPLEF